MKRIVVIFFFFLLVVTVFSFKKKDEKLVAAVCPTYHHIFGKDNEDIIVIKTDSTSESLELIKERDVNVVISGRALGKEEPRLLSQIIGEGYDFISSNEIIIFEEEMRFNQFYTNLEKEPIIKNFQYISEENLTKIEDINDYLDRGIVITSLEGFLIGESVHILNKNHSRVNLSRLPRVYYFEDFPENKLDILHKALRI